MSFASKLALFGGLASIALAQGDIPSFPPVDSAEPEVPFPTGSGIVPTGTGVVPTGTGTGVPTGTGAPELPFPEPTGSDVPGLPTDLPTDGLPTDGLPFPSDPEESGLPGGGDEEGDLPFPFPGGGDDEGGEEGDSPFPFPGGGDEEGDSPFPEFPELPSGTEPDVSGLPTDGLPLPEPSAPIGSDLPSFPEPSAPAGDDDELEPEPELPEEPVLPEDPSDGSGGLPELPEGFDLGAFMDWLSEIIGRGKERRHARDILA